MSAPPTPLLRIAEQGAIVVSSVAVRVGSRSCWRHEPASKSATSSPLVLMARCFTFADVGALATGATERLTSLGTATTSAGVPHNSRFYARVAHDGLMDVCAFAAVGATIETITGKAKVRRRRCASSGVD